MNRSDALDGAYIRLNGPEKRFAELLSLYAEVVNKEIQAAVDSLSVGAKFGQFIPPYESMDVLKFHGQEFPIPPEVSVLIGEVLYNLRACLDYTVYELSALDSGAHKGGTQFPIKDTPDGFKRRRKGFLNGINDSHAAAIERLQPYNGVNWTKVLRTLSNPDKHRYLVFNTHTTRMDRTTTTDPADPWHGLFLNCGVSVDGREVCVNLHITFFIAFDDGLPVIETLEEIKTQVAQVLADFKPEFQPR
jgi:hypothetical protein